MTLSLADIPLVPLVASQLRRLEYSPFSPPFYGRLALYDEARRPDFAKPLHNRALLHALPDQPRLAGRRTMETEVACWSSDGDVEFRARVLPGYGFYKKGGLRASPDVSTAFTDFNLSGSLVVFVLGFNDEFEEWHEVEKSMRDHANSYRQEKCKVAFIEADDHHNSRCQWITDIAKELSQEDPENIIFLQTTTWDPTVSHANVQDDSDLKFPFPARGWASESSDDSWHLSQQGLKEWLPVVKDVIERLAKRMCCLKVLLVTDSTFQAHDYIQYECVIVRTKCGATTTFGISKSSTVRNLQDLIIESGFPMRDLRLEQINLAVSEEKVENGQFLQADEILADCGVKDGFMLHLVVEDGLEDPCAGVPGVSPLAFYLTHQFCWEPRMIEPGLYRMQLTGVEDSLSQNADHGYGRCYFGAGYRKGKTMSEEGVRHRAHQNDGIYGSTDIHVAMLYACPYYEHKAPQAGRIWKSILEGRVKAGKWHECRTLDHWYVPNKHDIEVVALIVQVIFDPSSIVTPTPALPPTPEHEDGNIPQAVEVTPEVENTNSQRTQPEARAAPEETEVEHTSSQQSNADSTTAALQEAPAIAASTDPLRSQDMPSLTQKFQTRFKRTPEWGKIEMDPDDAQRFRTTASIPGEPPVQGEWARGKQEAKRVALVKLLSETPAAVETPTVAASSDSISQLNERYQKQFLESPKWEERSSTAVGKCRAAVRLPSGSVIEGPDCDSKQEAKIAALRQALEDRA